MQQLLVGSIHENDNLIFEIVDKDSDTGELWVIFHKIEEDYYNSYIDIDKIYHLLPLNIGKYYRLFCGKGPEEIIYVHSKCNIWEINPQDIKINNYNSIYLQIF